MAFNYNRMFLAVAAQFLQHGASILILPLLLFKFSEEAMGVWYVVVSFQSAVFLLDMGFNGTFARALAQGFAGVQRLKQEGWQETSESEPNYELCQEILARMIVVYVILGVTSFIITLPMMMLYFSSIEIKAFSSNDLSIIGYLTSFGIFLQFSGHWINASLIGTGYTHLSQISVLLSRAVFLILGATSVMHGFGILGLLSSNVLGMIAGWLFKLFAFRRTFPVDIDLKKINSGNPILRTLWFNAWRIGVTAFASFCILRFGILLIGFVEGLEAAGILGLLVQISSASITAAMIPWQVGLKEIIKLKITRNKDSLRSSVKLHWSISFAILSIIFFSLLILEINGLFLGSQFDGIILTKLFFIYFIILVLEVNHTIAAHYIAAGNRIPFVRSAVISALFSVMLSSTLAILGYGIIGVLLGQGIVQLMWNNWIWPYKVWKELYAQPT